MHGIPSEKRILREGDLVSLISDSDSRGTATDMARTVAVGPVSAEADRLLRITRESLDLGITNIRAGAHLSDVVVQRHAEQNGSSCATWLGDGYELHEDPQVPTIFMPVSGISFSRREWFWRLNRYHALGLQVRIAPDGGRSSLMTGKLSGHFEDTIIVTESGTESSPHVARDQERGYAYGRKGISRNLLGCD